MKRRRKVQILFLTFLLLAVVLTGCAHRSGFRIGYRSSAMGNKMSAKFILLSGTNTKYIKLTEGDVVSFQYELKAEKGELTVTLIAPSGDTVFEVEASSKGEETAVISESGRHTLKIRGQKARGSYNISWTDK